LERLDGLKAAEPGAPLLLKSPYKADEGWGHPPPPVQGQIIPKRFRVFVVDGYQGSRQAGLGGPLKTLLQTCFFAISGILPRDEAIAAIKGAIKKTYGKRGEAVVQKNFAAVDATLDHLVEVRVPDRVSDGRPMRRPVPLAAPEFVQNVLG